VAGFVKCLIVTSWGSCFASDARDLHNYVGHACSSLSSYRMQTDNAACGVPPLVQHVASELQMVFVRCNALALWSFLQMVFVLCNALAVGAVLSAACMCSTFGQHS
jgi:hypothetical protein